MFKIVTDTRLNHRLTVTSGVLERECAEILGEFFREKRRQKAELKAKTRRGGRVDEGA